MNAKCCPKCKTLKPADAFGADKNRRDGKHPWCRPCARAGRNASNLKPEVREKRRVYQREWARRDEVKARRSGQGNAERARVYKWRSKLRSKYGLTEREYLALLNSQGGLCAACREQFPSSKLTHIDHCHRTGKVRGILCGHCNRALGGARDSVAILKSLAAYLEAKQ